MSPGSTGLGLTDWRHLRGQARPVSIGARLIRLGFHGAAGTVTGSRFLLEVGAERILIDCGMFQGLKELRERNWAAPGFDAAAVQWVLLTHAHIDHSGYLPRLGSDGFNGSVLCTAPTLDLVSILLYDAANLQEEDARFLNEHRL